MNHHHSRFFFYLILFLSQDFPALSRRFSPSQHNLTLYGDAFFRDNTISLTKQKSCFPSSPVNSSSGVGRALYVYPIKFLEPSTNTTASFSCRFSFSILASPSCPFGDGFAFLITSKADSFVFSNGFLGLPDPHDSFIAVEFDTSFDPVHGDINDNHVGIDVNSVFSVASVDAISKGIDLKSGREMRAWIEYSDALKLIRVWVGYSPVKPETPVLAAQIDLTGKVKEYMHVGFSASNAAAGSALHIVERWRFRTFGSHPDAIQEDDDCLVCSGDDFKNPGEIHRKGFDFRVPVVGLRIPIWSLLPGLAAIAILTAFIVFSLIRGKKVNPEDQVGEGDTNSGLNRIPGRLSLAEIKSATLGFNENTIVGQGASATVYKGSIPTIGSVAVKRFDRAHWPQCNRNPFTTEFTTMTGYLRHKNLVQFQGWCSEGTETALVFEYLPNGSLSQFLHRTPSSEEEFLVLSWKQRVNIILGVASAITYLHEECERQIIHRDVKTCNIMLDAEFNAKLGDFGLAEVYEHSALLAGRDATLPAGTMGYLAPEYVFTGVPSEKTDVYSFGIVVLEVCTGRRPVGDDQTVLVDLMWSLWEKGKVLDGADVMLKEEFDAEEMERVLMVGMVCSHPDCEKRPSVKEAVRIIRGEAPLPVLPARRPLLRMRSAREAEQLVADGLVGEDLPWMTPKSQF